MAKKKRTTKTKRRPRRMGDGKAKTKRRRTRRHRKGLGEMFTTQGVKKGAMDLVVGGGGGMIAGGLDRISDNEWVKGGVTLGVAFAASALGYERLGAGIAGGYAALRTKEMGDKMLHDWNNAEYTDSDALNDYPDALSEDGKPLYLGDDGYLYVSDDFRKNEDGTFTLSDSASPYDASMAVANY